MIQKKAVLLWCEKVMPCKLKVLKKIIKKISKLFGGVNFFSYLCSVIKKYINNEY